MEAITTLLGTELKSGKETVATSAALAGTEVVALYFSAHWCGPCRGFTPKLVTTLEQLKEDGKSVEIVFVSSDKDEASFDEYFAEMDDFHALPFSDRDRKTVLSNKYKVQGIPTLVLVDGKTGEAYNTDARGDVGEDPMGKKFPWRPPTLADAMGEFFVNGKGEQVAVASVMKGNFGLYFSAHASLRTCVHTSPFEDVHARSSASNSSLGL